MVLEVGAQRSLEPVFAGDDGDQLDFGTSEVDRGRQDREIGRLRGVDHMIRERGTSHQHLVRPGRAGWMVNPERGRGVSLGIEIHQQHREPAEREGSRHVDARCGLADATLLVRDDEDAGEWRRRQRGGCRTLCGGNGRRVVLDRR